MSVLEGEVLVASVCEQSSVIEGAVVRARARWRLRAETEAVRRHVVALGDRCGDLEPFGDELVLACSCLQGDAAALAVLEHDYIGRLRSSLLRFGTHEDFTVEVMQLLRHRLLLRPEQRLAMYAATGPLLTWLRVVAGRVALGQKRSTKPHDELLAHHVLDVPFVEASEIPRYRQTLDVAVRRVFSALSLRERNLLRLHYLDGLTLDQLARLNDVHRATAARWLATLRRRMLDQIEHELKNHLKVSASEVRSIVGMVMSRLDASLSLLLRVPESSP